MENYEDDKRELNDKNEELNNIIKNLKRDLIEQKNEYK